MTDLIKMIPSVDASDFPKEVLDWFVEHNISTHYQNDIAQVEDDGNPFAEWLKANGYIFTHKRNDFPDWDNIAIFAT